MELPFLFWLLEVHQISPELDKIVIVFEVLAPADDFVLELTDFFLQFGDFGFWDRYV